MENLLYIIDLLESNTFLPIINGYQKMDCEMAKWKNSQRGECVVGNKLANLYVKDMVIEHFKTFGKKDEMLVLMNENESIFENNPELCAILKSPKKLRKFIFSNYMKGIIWWFERMIRWNPVCVWYLNKKKFTANTSEI